MDRQQVADPYKLLSTKLAPPHLRPPVVTRRRLLDRLDQGLAHKLTLLSAPAGFGKTTLAAEWMETGDWETGKLGTGKPTPQSTNLPISQPTNLPIYHVAWVSLDAGDNDPVRFWRYVISACGAFDPAVGDSSLALLQTSQQPAFEAVLTAFINELAGLPGKCALILEDYHVVTARPVHETLTFWLDYLPPALHVVMLTRGDPPLPLARLRAHNELNELRAADLRFSPEETRDFLRLAVPFSLPAGAVERLADRIEGWPAGLRLVALALQRRQAPEEIDAFLATFTGSHRPILDYLVADVLGAQPEPVQEFLLQTAFLSRLTGPLCDAVYQSTNFPISQSTNLPTSQAILEHLERANLFVIPLDDRREWYRYHTLFAEAMQHHARQRLGEARLRELSRRASLWYAGHGLLGEAVEAALAARDYPQAADLVERVVAPELVHNEYHTLRRWMEQLPEEVLRLHPRLYFTYAVAILFTSVRHAAATRALLQTPLDMAEQAWQAAGDRPRLGEVVAFRSLVAWLQREYARSFSLARQSLELLPGDEAQWRGIALIMAGVEELWAGELNAARPTLTQARALCQAAGNLYGTLDTTLILGDLCVWQGDLGQAGGLYRQALSTAEQAPIDRDQALQRRGRALAGLAGLALELNDREAAGRDAAEALDIGRQLADEELLVRASLVLARLELARGEAGPARGNGCTRWPRRPTSRPCCARCTPGRPGSPWTPATWPPPGAGPPPASNPATTSPASGKRRKRWSSPACCWPRARPKRRSAWPGSGRPTRVPTGGPGASWRSTCSRPWPTRRWAGRPAPGRRSSAPWSWRSPKATGAFSWTRGSRWPGCWGRFCPGWATSRCCATRAPCCSTLPASAPRRSLPRRWCLACWSSRSARRSCACCAWRSPASLIRRSPGSWSSRSTPSKPTSRTSTAS